MVVHAVLELYEPFIFLKNSILKSWFYWLYQVYKNFLLFSIWINWIGLCTFWSFFIGNMLFALLYMQILLQCRYIKKLSTISIQINSAMEFSARNGHISDLRTSLDELSDQNSFILHMLIDSIPWLFWGGISGNSQGRHA